MLETSIGSTSVPLQLLTMKMKGHLCNSFRVCLVVSRDSDVINEILRLYVCNAKLQKRDLDIYMKLSRELTKQLRVCEATEQTWKNFIQLKMLR